MALMPAYAVNGGAGPAAMFRREAWVSAQGATGVTRGTDLRVTATAVPSNQVQIMPGGGSICDGYRVGEGYIVANTAVDGDALVDVPAQGSSGPRTDYLGIRVEDPEFGGQEPGDPLTAKYNRPVLLSSLSGITYPFLPLASITLPANTATITQDMITDLRQVANPRSRRFVRTWNPDTTTLNSSDWRTFPAKASWDVDVPEWATHAIVLAIWTGLAVTDGNVIGDVRAEVAGVKTQATAFNYLAQGGDRQTIGASGTLAIPAARRGTSQTVMAEGRRRGGNTNISADGNSSFHLDVEFVENPD